MASRMIRVSPAFTGCARRGLDLPDDRVQLRRHLDFRHVPCPRLPCARNAIVAPFGGRDGACELGSRHRGIAPPRGAGAADGRAGQGQAPARCRQAHGARAHRRAARSRQLPRDRRARRPRAIRRGRRARSRSSRPTSCSGAAASTAGRSWSAATTSRCAAARPTRRSAQKQVHVRADGERAAPAARAPGRRHRRRRLGEDASRRMGYTYVPANPGWEWVVANLGTVPVVALGLGSVAGLGAARLVTSHYSVMVEGISQMFVAGPPVVARARRDRRPRKSSAAATSTRAPARSTTWSRARRRRSRARGGSSPICRRRCTSCRARIAPTDDPGAARRRG